jgi:hypothetical protein
MTDEWPSLLAQGDKIVPILAFGKWFLVELPPRSVVDSILIYNFI